jgi:hypothetical protein
MSYNQSLNPNSNYPAMTQSQWDDAPFNELVIPERDFDITCSQSLSKTVTVTTNNYIPGASGVDYEPDDEGGCYAVPYHDDPDTSDTNWAEEYHENDYHTPLQLIELFAKYLKEEIEYSYVDSPYRNPKILQKLLEECEGWCEDETEFIEN